MGDVTALHYPGVTGTIEPVNARQRQALMRTGWRPADPTEPVDAPELGDEHPNHTEES